MITGNRAAHNRSERTARETLTYLPAWCGESYAHAIVAGEILHYDLQEAWEGLSQRQEILRRLGTKSFYLDLNHDFRSRMFEIDRMFFVPNAGIFADGRWTEIGLLLRPLFKGVSPTGLAYSKKFPPSKKLVEADKKQHAEDPNNMKDNVDSFGPLGAICVGSLPTFSPYLYPATLEAIKGTL